MLKAGVKLTSRGDIGTDCGVTEIITEDMHQAFVDYCQTITISLTITADIVLENGFHNLDSYLSRAGLVYASDWHRTGRVQRQVPREDLCPSQCRKSPEIGPVDAHRLASRSDSRAVAALWPASSRGHARGTPVVYTGPGKAYATFPLHRPPAQVREPDPLGRPVTNTRRPLLGTTSFAESARRGP